MHARTLNPYVASALDEWRGKHHVQPAVLREASCWPLGASALAGCSSFGMSGTNAHGLFAAPPTLHLREESSIKLSWQRSRHWPQAPANHMLSSAVFDRSATTCKLQVPLAAPQLSFLLDHIIQNTPIMPGAGMLETAAAACSNLRDADSGSGRLLCLTGAAIPAPVVLQVGSAAVLECHVNCVSGDIQLRSARGSAFQIHFKSSAGTLAPLSILHSSDNEEPQVSSTTPKLSVLSSFVAVKKQRDAVRCTAVVVQPPRDSDTSGFLGHPAVMDNALQLGPATGDVGKEDDAEVTRVVAGISAFVVSDARKKLSRPGFAATPTATERAPMAADGTIFTNHWLLGGVDTHSVFVMNLQAKVINLEASSTAAAAAVAEDKSRLIYAVEWQASVDAAEYLSFTASEERSVGLTASSPTYLLTHKDAAKPSFFEFPATSSDPAQATTEVCSTHVTLVQTLMQLSGSAPRGQLRLHSHGAHPAARALHGATAEATSSSAALSMQSFMRVASTEYPATQWSSLDLAQAQHGQQRNGKMQQQQQQQQQRVDSDMYCRVAGAGLWTTPRLLVRTPSSSKAKDHAINADLARHLTGSIIITGGMGALGTLMATWLAALGAPKLWLLGRSGRVSGDPLPKQLYAAAGEIVCARGDVSSSEEAGDIMQQAGASAAEPLRSVMHAGAVLDSKVISNVSAHSIRTEYSGKVFGAQQLLRRAAPTAISTFQLFSSLASFSGAAGQATYAAANGVLDAWSHAAQGAGSPAVAVQWGNWGGGGMAVRNKGFIERMEKMGLGILDPDVGLGVMARMLYDTAVPAVMPLNAVSVGNIFLWDNIVRALPAVPAFLEEFARPEVLEAKLKAAIARSRATAAVTAASQPILAPAVGGKRRQRRQGGDRRRRQGQSTVGSSGAAAGASQQQQQQQQTSAAVLDVILNIIANLGGEASADQPFMESGIDSLGAVQLRNEITSAFGVELQPTVTFDYPTPKALSAHVASQVSGGGDVGTLPSVLLLESSSRPEEPSTSTTAPSAADAPDGNGSQERGSAAAQPPASVAVDVLPDVMTVVENVIGTALGPEDPLMASGLDSLGAVQLRNAISERFGVELPATAALDFPTSAALAKHIGESTGVAVSVPSPTELYYYSGSDAGFDSITEVVGMSCIYPGQAAQCGAAGFWRTAQSGKDLPSVIPPGRWDIERHYAPDVTGNAIFHNS